MEDSKMTKAESGKLGSFKRAENIKKRYEENPKKCKHCGKVIPYEFRHMKVFCDHSCAAIYNNAKLYGDKQKTKQNNKCQRCGKDCDNKFCSLKCQQQLKCDIKIEKWKNGELQLNDIINTNGQIKPLFRKYLLEKFNNKCVCCGWDKKNPVTGKCPLEVEHIDGNHENNKEENLTILCPNCHSLTATYKALNKGNGRNQRMSRYKEGKTF